MVENKKFRYVYVEPEGVLNKFLTRPMVVVCPGASINSALGGQLNWVKTKKIKNNQE